MLNLNVVLKGLREQRNQIASNLESVDAALIALSVLDMRARQKSGIRNLSRAGRARIAAAQKARWAKWKKQHRAA